MLPPQLTSRPLIERRPRGTAASVKRFSLGLLTLLLLPFAPACDQSEEPEPLTIVDKSAKDAAALTTDVACEYVERCGFIEQSCPACADGENCGECTTEHVAVSHEECLQELEPPIAAGFSCQELTADEQALVDECLAALTTAECPTIETASDDDEPEAGGGAPEGLEACDVLDEIIERCYEQSEPEPSEPQPG